MSQDFMSTNTSTPDDPPPTRWTLSADPGPCVQPDPDEPPPPPPADVRGQSLIFCPRCGSTTPEFREFCTRCGARRCVGCGD